MRLFGERDLNLNDSPLCNAKFTFFNFRESHICCRLDWFFFSKGWVEFSLLGSKRRLLGWFFTQNLPNGGLLCLDLIIFGLSIRILLEKMKIWWEEGELRGEVTNS